MHPVMERMLSFLKFLTRFFYMYDQVVILPHDIYVFLSVDLKKMLKSERVDVISNYRSIIKMTECLLQELLS